MIKVSQEILYPVMKNILI